MLSTSTKREKSAVVVSTIVILALLLTALIAQICINSLCFDNPIVQIRQNGELIHEIPLSSDIVIELDNNSIAVHKGEIAVTAASCTNQLCVKTGYISGAIPIVCLPNSLEVRIVNIKTPKLDYDAITG